ncbi:MAG: hypothetical protein Q4B06_02625 [Candidatus Saccharibacteria bacterium]|nr:hypothetical protein [Candidatus Saccharibacteria bacterium]
MSILLRTIADLLAKGGQAASAHPLRRCDHVDMLHAQLLGRQFSRP